MAELVGRQAILLCTIAVHITLSITARFSPAVTIFLILTNPSVRMEKMDKS
jgi:hypothetical protein